MPGILIRGLYINLGSLERRTWRSIQVLVFQLWISNPSQQRIVVKSKDKGRDSEMWCTTLLANTKNGNSCSKKAWIVDC